MLVQLSMKQFLGIAMVVLMGVVSLFNGFVMLISPPRWFDLPPYIGFQGSLRRKMLLSLAGRLQIRISGLILLTFTIWIASSALFGPRGAISKNSDELPRRSATPGFLLAFKSLVVVAMSAMGVAMLLNPDWWIDKYGEPETPAYLRPMLRITTRISGVLLVIVSCYVAWQWWLKA
jgi:hypothetical protein